MTQIFPQYLLQLLKKFVKLLHELIFKLCYKDIIIEKNNCIGILI